MPFLPVVCWPGSGLLLPILGSGDPLGLSASTLSQTMEACLSHSQVFLFQYSLPYSRCIVSVEIRNSVFIEPIFVCGYKTNVLSSMSLSIVGR